MELGFVISLEEEWWGVCLVSEAGFPVNGAHEVGAFFGVSAAAKADVLA